MLKKLTLLILLVPVVAYSQTTEVTNDVKSHCKSFNDTAFWSEEESLCTVSVEIKLYFIMLEAVFKRG